MKLCRFLGCGFVALVVVGFLACQSTFLATSNFMHLRIGKCPACPRYDQEKRHHSTNTTSKPVANMLQCSSNHSIQYIGGATSCEIPGWKDFEKNQRVALVLRGGAVRPARSKQWPSWLSAFATQRACSYSQLDFVVLEFERFGFEVDVFAVVHGGPLDFDQTLKTVFGKRLRSSCITTSWGGQGKTASLAMDLLLEFSANYSISYRYIVLSRHDVCLKISLANLVMNHSLADRRMLAPFPMGREVSLPTLHSDLIQVIPAKLIGCLPSFFFMTKHLPVNWGGEGILRDVVSRLRLDMTETVGFLIEWMGASNNMNNMNPLYAIAGRLDGPYPEELENAEKLIAQAKKGKPPKDLKFGHFRCCDSTLTGGYETKCMQCALWNASGIRCRGFWAAGGCKTFNQERID